MAIYYIDLVNGSDAAAGTSWATAWKTVNTGSTAARIAPGDTIRMAKSPDKISLGNGTWTSVISNGQPNAAASTITGATNATPIEITIASHGFSTGDAVSIGAVGGNSAANGNWIITVTGANTFTLDGSIGNSAYTSGGTCQNINFRSVRLASNTQTKLINDCNTTFTSANGSTVTLASNSKGGAGALQVASPASSANNTLYAYQTLQGGAQDFSAYTHITLWYFTSTVVSLATTWRVCLCSDASGTTIVDSFALPISGTTSQWNSLVIPKTGGGSLSSSIRSIAIYTGANSLNSSTIILDNINACTATGLNLQSVISPVSSNTDIYENYPISSIVGNVISLDNDYNTAVTNSSGQRGYSGTNTGTITTYYRQALDYATLNGLGYTTISGAMFDCQEAGTVNNITTWSGGWNTSNTTQDGLTLVYPPSGSVGWSQKDYNKIEWNGIYRSVRGFGQNTSQARTYSGWTISNCFASGAQAGFQNQATSILAGPIYPNYLTNFGAINCGNNGVAVGNQVVIGNNIKLYNCCTSLASSFAGGAFTSNCGAGTIWSNVEVHNSGLVAFFNTGDPETRYYNVTSRYNYALCYAGGPSINFNTVTSVTNSFLFYTTYTPLAQGNQYVQDITYNDSTVYSNGQYGGSYSLMSGLNGTNSSFLGYTYQGVISRETSITHSGSSSWKVNVLTTARDAGFPVTLTFGQIYLKENVSTTISAWMYLTSANLGANLTVAGYQIPGVTSNQVATANSATVNSWQQVSMTFTPTSNGVVTLQANVWLTSGSNQSVYIDDLTYPIGISTNNMEQPYFGLPWVQNAAAPSVAYGAVGL